MKTHVLLFCGSALALACVSPVLAQEASSAQGDDQASVSSDIIVTAQRRAERLQDVPITIQNIGANQLNDANIQELSDIPSVTPGLRFDNQGPFTQPTIRGIGSAIVTSGSGSNVGIYVDGFFVPNPIASDFQLLSVENIQVLKGPQGTLFGRNTTGGAILISTAKPQEDPTGVFSASYGRFNAVRLEGYVSSGIAQNLAMDLGGQFGRGDGYIRNVVTGSRDDAQYKNWSIRTGLKFDPADNVSILLRYQHQENNDPASQLGSLYSINGQPLSQAAIMPGGVVTTRPGRTSITDDVITRSNNDSVQLTVTADLDFATLTSYTQYRDERSVFQQTTTSATPNFVRVNVPIHDKTFSQELLLTSKPGGRLQWTAGAFFLSYRDRFRANVSVLNGPFGQIAGSNSDTRTLAFFLDGTYEVTDNLFVTVGARYSHDEVRDGFFESAGATGLVENPVPTLKGDRVTPRFVVRYALDPRSSIYASYTKGYKSAIYNLGGQSRDVVNPENIDAFEIGFKHADGPLSFDLSAFYYDYKDLQVSSYGVIGGVPVGFVNNAAAARIYGVEAQFRYEPVPGFELNGGAAYMSAKYKHFFGDPFYTPCFGNPLPAACAPGDVGTLIVTPLADGKGFQMQRAPELTANFGAKYDFDLGGGRLALSGNVYYTSKIFFDPAEQVKQGAYATVGLRAEWTDPSERFSFALYGDNVTNNRHIVTAQLSTFSAPVLYSAPVTYGAEIRYRFR